MAGTLSPESNVNKRPLKILKVEEKGINVLTVVDKYEARSVHFFVHTLCNLGCACNRSFE